MAEYYGQNGSADFITMDAAGLIDLLDRVAQSADFVCREQGLITAKLIVEEAKARERWAVTGVTNAGIHWEATRDGEGYVVMGYEAGVQDPVDKYLEYGTKYESARPFFMAAALLEEGPHLDRLTARLQEWLDEVGR